MTDEPVDLHALAAPTPDPQQLQRAGDPEDLGTLGQMMALGAEYIDDQDEGDAKESQDIAAMQGVLDTLAGLAGVEATETEPPEQDDE